MLHTLTTEHEEFTVNLAYWPNLFNSFEAAVAENNTQILSNLNLAFHFYMNWIELHVAAWTEDKNPNE